MSQPPEPKRVPDLGRFQLDGWSVHQAEGTLRSEGRVVRLEPRVMDVLVYLAAAPGTVVPKEELLEAVWSGAFIEEGALAQAIHSLRKALGDDARQPLFIQTIPKRGYRLIAPVVPEESDLEPALPGGSRPEPVLGSQVRTVPPATSASPRWRVWLLAALALLTVSAILGLSYSRSRRLQKEGGRIVVLPFEDFNKPADSYFTKALTGEITQDLSSLAALQVTSRTSALHYEGLHPTLAEIRKELNVDYVLEGSVQWIAGPEGHLRARITSRLIHAADDSAVWSDQFDSEVTDIFAVQSEISRQVIAKLGLALTPEQDRALRTPPTENREAYQAYLRGLELKNQPFYSEEHLLKAVSMFELATKIDPKFAAAWAELSQAHSYLAFNTDRSLNRVDAARTAMERAAALDPSQPSVGLARIYFSYRCEGDYDTALTLLNAEVKRFPNNAEVLQTRGFVLRRKGRFREAAEVLQHAYTLDPKAVMLVWATGETYRALRNYEAADRFFQKAISLAPDQPRFWEERVLNRLAWTGDINEARTILGKVPVSSDSGLLIVSFRLDFYSRDYPRALSRLSGEQFGKLAPAMQNLLSMLGVIARDRMGDHRGAQIAAETNRASLEELGRRFPKEPFYPALLAIALAQLGRSAQASALAEKTVRENQLDALGGPNLMEFQAITETILGQHHEAIGRLSRLLAMPYRASISANEIRLNPAWDPLRGNAEFEDLLRRASS
jgi:DNA-binding winged helix-turn-helix (wHTH) protein/TolB-like protein/Flp pilus assembly protein TadD